MRHAYYITFLSKGFNKTENLYDIGTNNEILLIVNKIVSYNLSYSFSIIFRSLTRAEENGGIIQSESCVSVWV